MKESKLFRRVVAVDGCVLKYSVETKATDVVHVSASFKQTQRD